MYDLEKADKIYSEKLMEDPKFAEKLMDRFREKMPEEFIKTMFEEEYGCHIVDKDMYDEATADSVRILYGGSVKPETIEEQMYKSDIDGALVGGASLKADSFIKIILGARSKVSA